MFNRVADFREKESEEYALKRDLTYMRRLLDDAWRNKNYKKVIELLEPRKSNLKRSELKKLSFAQKKEKKI